MKILDNINHTVREDLQDTMQKGSRVSIAAACFSIYAYQELKKQLEEIAELRFIFTSPTFVQENTPKERREFYIPKLTREKSLYGTEFEVRLRNELTQKALAKECADWVRRKVKFRSNVSGEQNLLAAKNSDDAIVTRIIDDKTQRVQRIRSEFIEFEHLCNTGTIASICTCTDSKGIMITHLCEHRLKLISLQELLIADLSGNVGVDGSKVIPLIKKLTGLANEQITGYTGSIDIQENHSDIYQKVYVQYIDERTHYLLFCEGLIGSILYDGLSLTDLREIAKKSIQEIVEDKNVKQICRNANGKKS